MAPYNPPIAHYCDISVKDIPESTMLKIIGKKGWYFKQITADCGANYIWWNNVQQIIEIWGSLSCMKIAKYNVQYHIDNINSPNYRYKYQPLPYFDFKPKNSTSDETYWKMQLNRMINPTYTANIVWYEVK